VPNWRILVIKIEHILLLTVHLVTQVLLVLLLWIYAIASLAFELGRQLSSYCITTSSTCMHQHFFIYQWNVQLQHQIHFTL